MQFHTKCVVLEDLCSSNEKLCNSENCYSVTQRYEDVNGSKNHRFRN